MKIKKQTRLKYLIIILVWLILLFGIIQIANLVPALEDLIYWVILGLYIFTQVVLKITSKVTLLFSFMIFIFAAIFATFHLNTIAEVIIKISFIGLLVGFVQSFFEYLFS